MINSRDIKQLHPVVERAAVEFLKRCEAKGLKVLITSTYRDYEEQTKIYNQGRTTPGSIITNAKAGYSWHNFKCAFDICKNVKGQEYNDNNFFLECGKIWEEMGGEWGGSWQKFVDKPHFQFVNKLNLSNFRAGQSFPSNCKMKWETTTIVNKPVSLSIKKDDDEEVLTEMKVLIDGKEHVVPSILRENKNYPDLRKLAELLGVEVGYDKAKRMVILTK